MTRALMRIKCRSISGPFHAHIMRGAFHAQKRSQEAGSDVVGRVGFQCFYAGRRVNTVITAKLQVKGPQQVRRPAMLLHPSPRVA